MGCSTPDSSVLLCLLEFAQIHGHWVGDAISAIFNSKEQVSGYVKTQCCGMLKLMLPQALQEQPLFLSCFPFLFCFHFEYICASLSSPYFGEILAWFPNSRWIHSQTPVLMGLTHRLLLGGLLPAQTLLQKLSLGNSICRLVLLNFRLCSVNLSPLVLENTENLWG